MRSTSLTSALALTFGVGVLAPALPAAAAATPAPATTVAPAAAPAATSSAKALSRLKPGTVLRSSPMKLAPELAAVGTGRRISYVSTAIDGRHIVVSGAVLTPRKRTEKPGRRDTVAWAHGTEGIADRCAPSRSPILESDPTYLVYSRTVAGYLRRGWTVAATDYEGLGTPGPHPYLNGESEARGVIDSVRAARNLDRSLSKEWVASGHSQGGQAALWAGEAARYAKGLRLQGVVGMAAASELDAIAPFAVGTLSNGYLVIALYGLAAVDPTVRPEEILAAPAKERLAALEGCYADIIGGFADLTAEQLLVGGELRADLLAKFAAQSAAQKPGTAPVLLVQGTADQSVPEFITDIVAGKYCALGTTVAVKKYEGVNHDDIPVASGPDVHRWIADRFAHKRAPSTCS